MLHGICIECLAYNFEHIQGSGKDQKSVSDNLTELKTVNAEGKIDTYNDYSLNMAAAKVNLGLFGVTVEYTFKVKEMKKVRVDNKFTKVFEVFSTADKIQVHMIFIYALHSVMKTHEHNIHTYLQKKLK